MPYLSDQQAMELAYVEAEKAKAQGEVPVGAVVIRDGEILGRGFNNSITNHDPSAHAEIIAMRMAGDNLKNYRLSGCSLYVTLEPCAMCATAILHARIARLVFATWDEKAGAVVSAENLLDSAWANHRVSWSSGVMQDECTQLLKDFFEQRRS